MDVEEEDAPEGLGAEAAARGGEVVSAAGATMSPDAPVLSLLLLATEEEEEEGGTV
jgi:hypothetical protein